MNIDQEKIQKAIRQTQMLLGFRDLVNKLDKDPKERQRIQELVGPNPKNDLQRVGQIFTKRYNIAIHNDEECVEMIRLLNAYMRKKKNRKIPPIENEEKKKLLIKQDYKCVFCGEAVDECSPVDHIIPFKYVGDELPDNYQILCTKCNSSKNKQLTYELIQLILREGSK